MWRCLVRGVDAKCLRYSTLSWEGMPLPEGNVAQRAAELGYLNADVRRD